MSEVDAEASWRTLDFNLRRVLLCSQAVLPAMVTRQRGRIVNLVSSGGARAWPGVSAYGTSKAAVIPSH